MVVCLVSKVLTRTGSLGSCVVVVARMKDEDEEAMQAHLCFAEFSGEGGFGGGLGVENLIKYSNQADLSLRRRGRRVLTCIGKEMGCFKK